MPISIGETKRIDGRLAALADPTRRRIVELLSEKSRTATELHRSFSIAAPAVSRHLRVLRESGLVTERGVPEDRRVRVYVLASEPIDELAGWLGQLSRVWQGQLDAFRDYVELRERPPGGRVP